MVRFRFSIATIYSLGSMLLTTSTAQTFEELPSLQGQHLRITVVEEGTFLVVTQKDDGSRSFSGYLIDMMDAISRRANFTYELLTPSGYGSTCRPQITETQNISSYLPFSSHYFNQYNCATSDVTERFSNTVPFQPTDLYLGMFYVTKERLLRNYFTVPFSPPYKGTPAMFGTAVRIPSIEELVEQQKTGIQPAACIMGSTATLDSLRESAPDLQIREFLGTEQALYESIWSGECPIHIFDAPIAAQFVHRRHALGECHDAKGMVRWYAAHQSAFLTFAFFSLALSRLMMHYSQLV